MPQVQQAKPTTANVQRNPKSQDTVKVTSDISKTIEPSAESSQRMDESALTARTVVPQGQPNAVTVWKDVASATQATLASIALVVGVIWFFLRRQRVPKANVELRVSHFKADEAVVVHANLRVTNLGNVLLRVASVLARVQQLLPLPSVVKGSLASGQDPVAVGHSEVPWPLLSERKCDWKDECREIEPGETDEFHFDFFVPPDITAVEVYTYIKNFSKKREIGWNTTTIYRLDDGDKDEQKRFGVKEVSGSAQKAAANRLDQTTGKVMASDKRDNFGNQEVKKQAPPKQEPAKAERPPVTQGPPKGSDSGKK